MASSFLSSGVEHGIIKDTADSFGGKEVLIVYLALNFILSIVAGVIVYYIGKWLDGDHRL